jgi:D-psicose/D-tagatose/L-ribulose 3-epimerase
VYYSKLKGVFKMAKCAAYALIWGPTFDKNYLYLFEHLKELGFDGIEIPLITSIFEKLPVNEMKKRVSDSGLSCVFCTGLDDSQNIASGDKGRRKRGMEHLKKCVDIVKEFDGNVLSGVIYGVWGGFSNSAPTEDELNWSAESLREVAEYSKILNVDLAFEPVSRFEGYLIATVQDGFDFLKRIGSDNVGLHLDTFQMNIEEKNLPIAIRNAGKKLYHFHVCASDRGIPGTGHIEWKGIFSALREIGYNRWLTVESFYQEPSAEASAAKVWRKLAPNSDTIAEGGLELIRDNLP